MARVLRHMRFYQTCKSLHAFNSVEAGLRYRGAEQMTQRCGETGQKGL